METEPTPPPPSPPPTIVHPPPNDGHAIAALVLGIAGLVVCPGVASAVAIVLGRQAERRIQESGGTLGGEGLARAGWITGIVGVVIAVIWIVVVVGIFVFTLAFIPFVSRLDVPPSTPITTPNPLDLLRWL